MTPVGVRGDQSVTRRAAKFFPVSDVISVAIILAALQPTGHVVSLAGGVPRDVV